MAFNVRSLILISINKAGSQPVLFQYETTDILSQVEAPSYFPMDVLSTSKDDLIYVKASDGARFYTLSSDGTALDTRSTTGLSPQEVDQALSYASQFPTVQYFNAVGSG